MTLHELWENTDCETLLYYEWLDYGTCERRIAEYDPETRFTWFTWGSKKVFSIKPEVLPEIGIVLTATLDEE